MKTRTIEIPKTHCDNCVFFSTYEDYDMGCGLYKRTETPNDEDEYPKPTWCTAESVEVKERE